MFGIIRLNFFLQPVLQGSEYLVFPSILSISYCSLFSNACRVYFMLLIFVSCHCIQNVGKDVGIIIWIFSGCIFYFKCVAVNQYTQAPYFHGIIILTVKQYKEITTPYITSLHMQISELKATNHSQNKNLKKS